MIDKTKRLSRVALLGVFLAVGSLGFEPAVAQDPTVPAVDEVADEADDSGFDDWGLLGLLGLAGLAGLLKRPTHEVRTVDRTDVPHR